MSGAKHTPGPWIGAGPSFGDLLPRYTTEIVTERENEDGEVEPICAFPCAHFDSENEANARLIAAAPELLEALRWAMAFAPRPIAGMTSKVHEEHRSRFQAAVAAIAKATGGDHE